MADVINFPSIPNLNAETEAQIFADLISGRTPKIGEECSFTLPDGPVQGTLTALIAQDGVPTEEFDDAQLMIVAFPDDEGFTVIPLGPRAHVFAISMSA
jgi:hypothetical protein